MLKIIETIEDDLTRVFMTKHRSYNIIKNHIAGAYSTLGIGIVEPSRTIANFLDISKSTVSRVLDRLEEDEFLIKTISGNHPKHIHYVVKFSKKECFAYRCFHSLTPYRKRKFFRNLTTCGAKTLEEIVESFLNRGIVLYSPKLSNYSMVGVKEGRKRDERGTKE